MKFSAFVFSALVIALLAIILFSIDVPTWLIPIVCGSLYFLVIRMAFFTQTKHKA